MKTQSSEMADSRLEMWQARSVVAASRQSAALFPQAVRPIPTGLCNPAQGWSAPDRRGTTLGTSATKCSTLKGLHRAFTGARNFLRRRQPRWGWGDFPRITQGSFATLGWKLESLWDSGKKITQTRTQRFGIIPTQTGAHGVTRPTSLALLLGFCFLLSAFSFRASGQTYSVDWHKIAGGGGTSTGGTYAVSGTIGQPDASMAMSSGQYSVTSGYWSLINVVQTAGAPTLSISYSGNTVTVYWQNVAGWNLYQSGNLATPIASWSSSSSPTLTDGTNYLNLVNPTGNLFFRLAH